MAFSVGAVARAGTCKEVQDWQLQLPPWKGDLGWISAVAGLSHGMAEILCWEQQYRGGRGVFLWRVGHAAGEWVCCVARGG